VRPVQSCARRACRAVRAASNFYTLARQLGSDAQFMAQILTLQTAFAALTMPVVNSLVR
jgi:malonate transporter and related proteins